VASTEHARHEGVATASCVPGLSGRYALVDLETTGGNAAWHRVIEVGIVTYEHGRVVEEWSSLVNPGMRIPAGIEAFTGISNSMVADAPAFSAVAAEVSRRLAGRVFVAHNARFDHGFLRNEFRRLGARLSAPVLCTVRLSRRLYPAQARHSLDAVMARHGIECTARHRALGDARVLARFLECAVADYGAAAVEAAIAALLSRAILPPQLPAELADELPDAPGVYRFYGTGGALLYVGKSANVRTRVLQHFAGEHRSSAEQKLARQVVRVDWIECAGELGALLLEVELVKRLQPIANRRLRRGGALWTIQLREAAGVLTARVEALDADQPGEACGLFRAEKDARRALEGIARDRELCRKVLGLETAAGSCFARQVGRCRGACIGAESPALHAARVRLALSAIRLQDWPHRGRIGIRERGPTGVEEIHVVDAWRYLGTARTDGELAELAGRSCDTPFDADVYRLLLRVLATRRLPVIDLSQPRPVE
jgi:DNA polymerase III subunit epsilon